MWSVTLRVLFITTISFWSIHFLLQIFTPRGTSFRLHHNLSFPYTPWNTPGTVCSLGDFKWRIWATSWSYFRQYVFCMFLIDWLLLFIVHLLISVFKDIKKLMAQSYAARTCILVVRGTMRMHHLVQRWACHLKTAHRPRDCACPNWCMCSSVHSINMSRSLGMCSRISVLSWFCSGEGQYLFLLRAELTECADAQCVCPELWA